VRAYPERHQLIWLITPGAAVWVGIRMSGIEKFDEDDVVGRALGLGSQQIADALY